MKFKKGDRVVVLDGSKIEDYAGGWVSEMKDYVGTIHTIQSGYCKKGGRVVYSLLDGKGYIWDERGLKLADEKQKKPTNGITLTRQQFKDKLSNVFAETLVDMQKSTGIEGKTLVMLTALFAVAGAKAEEKFFGMEEKTDA